MSLPTTHFELPHWELDFFVAGVDEAGRGAWAGPVVAAAVVLSPDSIPAGLNDSKKLSAVQREKLAEQIKSVAITYAIGIVEPAQIDEINILQATFLAMNQAMAGLNQKPNHVLVDGPYGFQKHIPETPIVDGDALSVSIAAASILAKTARDQIMKDFSQVFPRYGFESHVGYGTKKHQEALQKWGITKIHRKSYAPIKKLLIQNFKVSEETDKP